MLNNVLHDTDRLPSFCQGSSAEGKENGLYYNMTANSRSEVLALQCCHLVLNGCTIKNLELTVEIHDADWMLSASLFFSFSSVSQYDRRFGAADRWSVWSGWFYTQPRLQCVARVWLRGMEQWELPKRICGNHVWVWPHTKLYHHEGESPDNSGYFQSLRL